MSYDASSSSFSFPSRRQTQNEMPVRNRYRSDSSTDETQLPTRAVPITSLPWQHQTSRSLPLRCQNAIFLQPCSSNPRISNSSDADEEGPERNVKRSKSGWFRGSIQHGIKIGMMFANLAILIIAGVFIRYLQARLKEANEAIRAGTPVCVSQGMLEDLMFGKNKRSR